MPRNGARVVAKAWVDPEFRARPLAAGRRAVDAHDVRFRSEELWPDSSDEALVHVAVFQSYLERAD